MKFLIIFIFIVIGFIPIASAQDELDAFFWEFCDEKKEFEYSIVNGTVLDTIHLKLYETNNCNMNKYTDTDYQLQLIHTSNNQTDFTLFAPENLDFQEIQVRVVGLDYVKSFVLNDTNKSLTLSDFIHDKFGEITVILDFLRIDS